MSDKKPFSLKDFRDWFENKDLSEFSIKKDPNQKYIGQLAEAKVSQKKIAEKMEAEGNAEVLVSEFMQNGGTIKSIEGLDAVVLTESGEFKIPKFCIKMHKA